MDKEEKKRATYLWDGVASGQITGGVAIANAESIEDAKHQILTIVKKKLNDEETQFTTGLGTWTDDIICENAERNEIILKTLASQLDDVQPHIITIDSPLVYFRGGI